MFLCAPHLLPGSVYTVPCRRIKRTVTFTARPAPCGPRRPWYNHGHPLIPRSRLMSTEQPILPPYLTRREALLAAGSAAVLATSAEAADAPKAKPDLRRAAPKRYDMKKSINLWAFPYPQRM